MKKIFVLFALCAILNLQVPTFADTSNHVFPLDIPEGAVPQGGGEEGGGDQGGGGGDNGLSTGGIIGISVGVGGGLLALGGLVWLLKSYWAKGLKTGSMSGVEDAILPVCLDEESLKNLEAKSQSYPYLQRAIELNDIKECPDAKYVLIPDTQIQNKTFNGVVFKLPTEISNSQKVMTVRVTRVSNPFYGDELDEKIYLNAGKENVANISAESQKYAGSQIKLEKTEIRSNDGVLRLVGKIDFKNNVVSENAALVVSYDKPLKAGEAIPSQKYAYLLEFSAK